MTKNSTPKQEDIQEKQASQCAFIDEQYKRIHQDSAYAMRRMNTAYWQAVMVLDLLENKYKN